MANVIIWNKTDKLKNLDPEVWFNAYPQSKTKTLALIDESEVVFIEDLKDKGFTGDTDVAIVEAYIAKVQKDIEEHKKHQLQIEEEEKKTLNKINSLESENKTLKERVDTLSSTLEELILNTTAVNEDAGSPEETATGPVV